MIQIKSPIQVPGLCFAVHCTNVEKKTVLTLDVMQVSSKEINASKRGL